jgi:hypothetical protein
MLDLLEALLYLTTGHLVAGLLFLFHFHVSSFTIIISLNNSVVLFLFQSSGDRATVVDDVSDDWEFEETKVMQAQEELRSIRAKIAVLEGKIALEIMCVIKLASIVYISFCSSYLLKMCILCHQ